MFKGKLMCVCIYVLLVCAVRAMVWWKAALQNLTRLCTPIGAPLLAAADAFALFYHSVCDVFLCVFRVDEVPVCIRCLRGS